MDVAVLFRRRLKRLVLERFGSLDRFYLETEFSKGHLSNIIRGHRTPSLATLQRLAELLDVEVRDLFVFPERGQRDEILERIRTASNDTLRRVAGILAKEEEK